MPISQRREQELPTFFHTMQAYPFSMFIMIYGVVMGIFVTILMLFHVALINEFKTTQERLKKDKGTNNDKFSMSPHSHQSLITNWVRTLCNRKSQYKSKISWELLHWSKGDLSVLNAYWKSQEQRDKKFKRICKLEESVSIFDPPKSDHPSQ